MINQFDFTITRTRQIGDNTTLTEQIRIEGLPTPDDVVALKKFGFHQEAENLVRTYYPGALEDQASTKHEEGAPDATTEYAVTSESDR